MGALADRNIVLTGFMGAGKSLVGGLLAEKLGRGFVDTDAIIEEETGLTINEIFRRYGEPYFRQLEREQVLKLEGKRNLVIATGGGTLMNPLNLADLRRDGIIIYLRADFSRLMERVGKGGTRPLIAGSGGREVLERLLEEREGVYRQADLIIETSYLRPAEVVERILKLLACFPRLYRGKQAGKP